MATRPSEAIAWLTSRSRLLGICPLKWNKWNNPITTALNLQKLKWNTWGPFHIQKAQFHPINIALFHLFHFQRIRGLGTVTRVTVQNPSFLMVMDPQPPPVTLLV